jgi:hypothetical protein
MLALWMRTKMSATIIPFDDDLEPTSIENNQQMPGSLWFFLHRVVAFEERRDVFEQFRMVNKLYFDGKPRGC